MKMKNFIFTLIILVINSMLTFSQNQSDSLNDLISDLFGNNKNNNNAAEGSINLPTVEQNFGITSTTQNPNTQQNNNQVKLTGCSSGSVCVPYYLCKNNSVITDGEGIFDLRIDDGKPKQCPFLEQCCNLKDKSDVPVIKPQPTPNGCGYRNVRGIGFKIIGDIETEFGEFPWMVAILIEETNLNQNQKIILYVCGGSLIHPQVVLTAAHCVKNHTSNLVKVRAGEWDTQSKNELFPDQDRDVSEIIIHSQYYSGGLYNDIALLYLEKPFDLADNVKPVCLPPQNTQFDRANCFATGWGTNKFGEEGKYQNILKKIDLPIVPNNECQEKLRTTRLGNYFQLHQSFLCAGGEPGKDTCKGDGGSPLVCPIPGTNNRYYQAGIVAWGIGCSNEIPGVYANVPKLRSWIDEQLAYKRIDTSFFTP